MIKLLNNPMLMLEFLNGPEFFMGLSLLMFIFLEIGRRIRLHSSNGERITTTATINGPVETVIFAVLGLLIAFTFTGAGARFEARRHLIGIEANTIGTAYLRIDLLPKEAQPQMRDLFKQYTLIRANVYKNITDTATTQSRIDASDNLQKQMWNIAVSGCNKEDALKDCSKIVLPGLNEMFDITTTRAVASESHPPTTIYLLLIILSLFSALLVGYDLPRSGRRNLLYMLSYAIIISLILYIIVEIEMPRYGLITINEADHIISDLISSM